MEYFSYFYPRNKKGKLLGHSIAVIMKDNKAFIGFANLGEKDNFNKKIGRAIAESRAREQLRKFEQRKLNKNKSIWKDPKDAECF